MFARRFRCLIVALPLFIPAIALAEQEQTLADRLPREGTVLYAGVDLERLLSTGQRWARFVDPESGQKLVYQVKHFYSLLREAARNHEFQPALLDRIAEARPYLVIAPREEPKVTEHSTEVPQFSPETGQPEPGQTREFTFTRRSYYKTALVLETPNEELPLDFLRQFRDLMARQAEQYPDDPDFKRRDLEVEQGRMVAYGEGPAVGTLGRYIVFAAEKPETLWAALMAPASETVAATRAYRKLEQGLGEPPHGIGVVNVGLFFRKLEQRLSRAVEAAEQESGQQGERQGQPGFSPGRMRVQMARAMYGFMQTMKDLFSLDKLQWAGMTARYEVGDRAMASRFYSLLSHGPDISPVLEEILSGSGSFNPPPVALEDNMVILCRVSPGRVYDEITRALAASGSSGMMMFDMYMKSMKQRIGMDVGDILDILDSDSYVYLRFARKEFELFTAVEVGPDGTSRRVSEPEKRLVPEVTALWGVKDPRSARQSLSTLFTRLSTDAQLSPFVKKRTYQGADVYCIGPPTAESDELPNGLTSFALVVEDRYLMLGSWERVTETIRALRAGGSSADDELVAVAAEHPEASFIAAVPREFNRHTQELVREGQESDPFEQIERAIEEESLGMADQELEGRIKESLKTLVRTFRALNQKMTEMAPEMSVVAGEHRGNLYVIESSAEVRK
ncbi:MAG: hypothetical protein ACOC7T_03350 [Planctomycetota bacterium]